MVTAPLAEFPARRSASISFLCWIERVAVFTKINTAKVIYDDKVTKVSALVKATTDAGSLVSKSYP